MQPPIAKSSSSPGRIRIGCSGWQYKHWRGDFYPSDLPTSRWLEHYARTFDTVEVNNSFYRLPEVPAVLEWRARSPARFLFAWKASRFLTHMKKLKDPDEPIERLMGRARALGTKLGPILYQLPPHWGVDVERLQTFLRALPRGRARHVVEMRDPSWYSAEVTALLERRRVALCLHDMPGSATARVALGPFVYVRFHGAGQKYGGGYSAAHLARWARWLKDRAEEGLDAYAYFNNDVGGHAPRDAVTLREKIAALV